MLVLGIESSCDETAAAVVRDGQFLLSNVVASQIDIHSKYGGVVPEVASRKHAESIGPVIFKALEDAEVSLGDLSGIAVTNGPGLIGSILVGLSVAKAVAFARNLPFVAVNHVVDFLNIKDLRQTRDDAGGERFDKAAKMLNIRLPGGIIIDRLAKGG